MYSTEGVLLSFKEPDLNKLRAECYAAIIKQRAKGVKDIKVQFRICMWRKKYLVVSRFILVGTNEKNNKATSVVIGSNAIKKYVTAKWKYDHAQAKDIEWNVAEFECDGESVRMSTTFDERVHEAALKDIQSGIVDKSARGISSFLASIADHIHDVFRKG